MQSEKREPKYVRTSDVGDANAGVPAMEGMQKVNHSAGDVYTNCDSVLKRARMPLKMIQLHQGFEYVHQIPQETWWRGQQ